MLPGFLRQGVSYAARPGGICPSAISSSHRVASPYMQRNGMDAETEYLRRVAGGDQEAFRLLFVRHAPGLERYVCRIVGTTAVAEDIVQDVFTKVWLLREELGQVRSFSSYIYLMARNRAFDYLRRQAARRQHIERLPPSQALLLAEEYYHALDMQQVINSLVGSMPLQRLRVFTLSRREGLRRQEIARRLHISPKTVANHLHIALTQIRRALEDPHV